MNKIFFFTAVMLGVAINMAAQNQKTLNKVMTLKIDRPGGANGANVAWHPVQKKYYAAMAGNENFPMEVFDEKGVMLSGPDLNTMFDTRGLWYNPASKTLQINSYDNGGWAEYKLDGKGIPATVRKLSIVTSQPDPQSVGAYDAKKNAVYFYDYNTNGVERHLMKDGASDTTIVLHLGAKTKDDINESEEAINKDNYNQNAIVFTGISHAEIGILNTVDHQVELYDLSTGLLKTVLTLPESAPIQASLNFSYSNNVFWLFDKSAREWNGYKIK